MKSAFVSAAAMIALLSGCADDQVTVAHAHHRNHTSPPAVEAPVWPADSFDEAKAQQHLADAKTAQDKGDLATARRATEEALDAWPVAIEGWERLMAVCQGQNDAECERYAAFFHAKLLVVNGLPMRVATLGFQTVAENKVGTKTDNIVYDQKTLDMAVRLWVFCSQRDSIRDRDADPTEASFNETYPYVPVLLIIGVGAGVLTSIKEVAK